MSATPTPTAIAAVSARIAALLAVASGPLAWREARVLGNLPEPAFWRAEDMAKAERVASRLTKAAKTAAP